MNKTLLNLTSVPDCFNLEHISNTKILHSHGLSFPKCRLLVTMSDTCFKVEYCWFSCGLFLKPCKKTASKVRHSAATQLSNSVANSVFPPNRFWQSCTHSNSWFRSFSESSRWFSDGKFTGITADISLKDWSVNY